MKTFLRILIAVLVLILILVIWGGIFLDEDTEQASIPGLTAQWEGEQIALLSDSQSGMWLASEDVAEGGR
jgi:hypothetical protein